MPLLSTGWTRTMRGCVMGEDGFHRFGWAKNSLQHDVPLFCTSQFQGNPGERNNNKNWNEQEKFSKNWGSPHSILFHLAPSLSQGAHGGSLSCRASSFGRWLFFPHSVSRPPLPYLVQQKKKGLLIMRDECECDPAIQPLSLAGRLTGWQRT